MKNCGEIVFLTQIISNYWVSNKRASNLFIIEKKIIIQSISI
jgi:hypothetical protein